MKEIVFINKNSLRWQEIEQVVASGKFIEPDLLVEMYHELTDDLSYARTHYAETQTELYLNNLVGKLHAIIYKTKKEENNRFLRFWRYEFPVEIYKIRRYIYFSIVLFLFACFIGLVSLRGDEEFVRVVLGDVYVDMTIANIEKGEPMAVYASRSAGDMFFLIATNNLRVAAMCFLAGLLSYFGVVPLLFFNGVMLGSFQYFFYKYNVLYESVLSIWIHGTIEIFSIVISASAGLLVGSSYLFPGTYSRKASFIKASQRGAKIFLGISPFIILAAFLEAYATRHTEWADWLRIGIIVSSLILIVLYFVVYPIYLQRKFKKQGNENLLIEKLI